MEKRKVLLLIEDNKQDEILTLRALKQNGLRNEVVVCRDGVEGLEWLFCTGRYVDRDKTLSPHVVLLDLKLPKVDGHGVLHAIRANLETKRLPVVMLSTSTEESDIAQSYDNGANSYVQKPVSFEKFSEAIQRLGVYWLFTNETPNSNAAPSEPSPNRSVNRTTERTTGHLK